MNGFIGRLRNRRSRASTSSVCEQAASCSNYVEPVSLQTIGTTFSHNDDLGQPSNFAERVVRKCSIVYNLSETLRDTAALAYFIQFMEAIGQLNLIKFWLHVESFKASSAHVKENDGTLIAMIRNDAGNIFGKYICEDASCSIGVTDALRKDVINRICVKEDRISRNCFSDVQEFVKNIMEKRYFSEFLSSVYYLKHQLDCISSGAISIDDILRSQKLLSAFIEFLDGEGYRKLIEFIIAADTFTQQISLQPESHQLMEDALIIYEKYFSMQATDPLKFGAKTRIQVESDICTESGRPSSSCFLLPRRLAVSILEQTYLPRFLASPSFMKFLYELMRQIDSNIELPSPNRRKKFGSSGQSSELRLPYSYFENRSQHTSIHRLCSSTSGAFPMGSGDDDESASQADSVSSFGPGSSLKRSTGGILLATVDDFGRYRPMYDNTYSSADDYNSTTKKIKSMLDRYLHQTVTKEAEVADHVAQLVIADVQNMVSVGSLPQNQLS